MQKPNYQRVRGFLDDAKEVCGEDNNKLDERDEVAKLLHSLDTNALQPEADFRGPEGVLDAPALQVHRHDLCIGKLIPAKIGEQTQRCMVFLESAYDEKIHIGIDRVLFLAHEMNRVPAVGEIGDGNLLPSFHEDDRTIVFDSCDKSHMQSMTQITEEFSAVVAAVKDPDALLPEGGGNLFDESASYLRLGLCISIVQTQREKSSIHSDAMEEEAGAYTAPASVPNISESFHGFGIFLVEIGDVVGDHSVLSDRGGDFAHCESLHGFREVNLPEMVAVLLGLLPAAHIGILCQVRQDGFALREESSDEFLNGLLLRSREGTGDGTEVVMNGVSDVLFHVELGNR